MPRFRYGGLAGTAFDLAVSDEYMVVRTHSRNVLCQPRPYETETISHQAHHLLSRFELVTRFRDAGVEVFQAKSPADGAALRDEARSVLNAEEGIQFAGRVMVDPVSRSPVLYTENLFVKFHNTEPEAHCRAILDRYGLQIKRSLPYARNAYFVSAPAGTGSATFEIAESLVNEAAIDLCHPELVRQNRFRKVFPQQWHLKEATVNGKLIQAHAHVEAAWELSIGEGITIAVVDDGVDIDHEEFRSSGKIVAPRDVTRRTGDPRPRRDDDHGTACAGVACADGNYGASGVAPGAKLMPIRLASGLGSQAEADAFVWAAQNGADVISCSWGPPDGIWYDPKDPAHNQRVPLPDSTRLAIDFAVTQGRKGKGCVVCFAAGNGNESVDNDGYASYQNVIAVAACNDQGQRSAYSDFGKAVWCAFPSNHGYPSLTKGIWTTDRTGGNGYNLGKEDQGDLNGNYTNSFGGTSSACPGVAGVIGLILARNPELRWNQVREILKQSADKIDTAGGQYDSEGRSPLYGYGRVNARKAVELAQPPQPNPVVIAKAMQDVPIIDLKTVQLAVNVAETRPLKALKLTVDIDHTYIGDLVVSLKGPEALGLAAVMVHNREGGSTDNIKRSYDILARPDLARFLGKSPQGSWTLLVEDLARWDSGVLRSFALEMEF